MTTPVATAAIHLDEATHTYTRDGVVVPGVTEVLEGVRLIDYSSIPHGVRIAALERGRFVHRVCEFDDQGDLGAFDPALSGYLDAWRRFRDTLKFTPDLIEWRGFCEKHGYCGTLDRKSDAILLDIKTSVVPWWASLQTAAYAAFFPSPAKYRRMAVALHADGAFKIHEFKCADFSRDLAVFLAALTVFNAKRANQ